MEQGKPSPDGNVEDMAALPTPPEEQKTPTLVSTGKGEKEPRGENNQKPEKPLRESMTNSENGGPIGPPLDISSTITETSDILDEYRRFLSEQKTRLAMTSYYLMKQKASLEEYTKFLKKLENFFHHHAGFSSSSYLKISNCLPLYGDYTKVVKDGSNLIRLANVSSMVPERDVRKLVESGTDNLYSDGTYNHSMFTMCKNIKSTASDQRKIVNEVMTFLPFWFELLGKEVVNNEKQSIKMFEILSYINFLNSGIDEEPLVFELPANYK